MSITIAEIKEEYTTLTLRGANITKFGGMQDKWEKVSLFVFGHVSFSINCLDLSHKMIKCMLDVRMIQYLYIRKRAKVPCSFNQPRKTSEPNKAKQ